MKRFLSFAILALFCLFSNVMHATVIDGVNYTLDSSTSTAAVGTIQANNGGTTSGDITIPATVEYEEVTYNVTTITTMAYLNQTGLTSITLPATVTTIEEKAFKGCSGLASVTFADNSQLETISRQAFMDCTALTSITLTDTQLTSLGESAFSDCTKLTSVELPASLTTIDTYAFQTCTALESITLPSGLTSISDYMFDGCTKLTSVDLSGCTSLTSIGAYAFQKLGLTSIEIPSTVTSIGNYAFYKCTSLATVTFDRTSQLETIGTYVFESCTALTSIDLPASLTSLGNRAFYGSGLTSIEIPNSVTSIGQYAFSTCASLTTITFDAEAQSGILSAIGVFQQCTALTSVSIGEGITSIGSNTFYNCTNLSSVTIPSTCTSIGTSAFGSCTALTEIEIPASVSSISTSSFSQCTSLTAVNVNSDNSTYSSVDGIVFSDSGATLFLYPAGKTDSSYSIPETVTALGGSAFAYCTYLTSVEIPSTVTSLGTYVFEYAGLTSVEIPSSITSISNYAFYYCTSLESITIPSTMTSIGMYGLAYCSSLASIVTEATTPPTLNTYALKNVSETLVVTVPSEECIESYESAWGDSYTYVVAGEEDVAVGDIIIYDEVAYKVTSIDEDRTVSIAKQSDNGGKMSGDANIPATFTYKNKEYTVTAMEEYAFSDYDNYIASPGTMGGISTITFGDGIALTSIPAHAFDYCCNLEAIDIPEGVTSIGEYAFEMPTEYKSVVQTKLAKMSWPSTLTGSLGNKAFTHCGALEQITCYSSNTIRQGTSTFNGVTLPNIIMFVPCDCSSKYTSWGLGEIVEFGCEGESYGFAYSPSADDTVESLSTITVYCSDNFSTTGNGEVTLCDADGEQVATGTCAASGCGYVITLSETISDDGLYTLKIPAGYFTIGDGTNEAIDVIYTVGEVNTEITTIPADGDVYDEGTEITEINLQRNGWLKPVSTSDYEMITVTKPNGDVVHLDDVGNPLSYWWATETKSVCIGTLDGTLKASGEYTITIPAGKFYIENLSDATKNATNEEIEIKFTILGDIEDEETEEDTGEIEVTPAEGTVESLSSFTFSHDPISLSWINPNSAEDDDENIKEDAIILYASDGETVVTTGKIGSYEEHEDELAESSRYYAYTEAIIDLDEEVTAPGTYILYVPEGFFYIDNNGNTYSDEMRLTYVISGFSVVSPEIAVGDTIDAETWTSSTTSIVITSDYDSDATYSITIEDVTEDENVKKDETEAGYSFTYDEATGQYTWSPYFDMSFTTGHTYAFKVTVSKQGQTLGEEVLFYITGTADAPVYSSVTVTDLDPMPYEGWGNDADAVATIEDGADGEFVWTFSDAVKIDHAYMPSTTGTTDLECTATGTADSDGYCTEWTITVPNATIVDLVENNGGLLAISVYATDAEGYQLFNGQYLYVTYTLDYEGELDLSAYTFDPEDGATVSSISTVTVGYPGNSDDSNSGGIAYYGDINGVSAYVLDADGETVSEESSCTMNYETDSDETVDENDDLDEGYYTAYTATIAFSPTVTDAGTYTVVIPAGYFIVGQMNNATSNPKITLTYTIADVTGIDSIRAAIANGAEVYTISGQKVSAPVSGVNVVKYADGTVKKILQK